MTWVKKKSIGNFDMNIYKNMEQIYFIHIAIKNIFFNNCR